VLESQGKLKEAEPYYADALEMSRRLLGPDHPTTLTALQNMGYLRQLQGRLVEAEVCLREVIERRGRVQCEDHEDILAAVCTLASVRQMRGDAAEAERLYMQVMPRVERKVDKDHWMMGHARAGLGAALTDLGRYSEAETALVEGERVLARGRGAPPGRHEQCLKDLVALYDAWDKAEPGKGHDSGARLWKERLGQSGEAGRAASPGK